MPPHDLKHFRAASADERADILEAALALGLSPDTVTRALRLGGGGWAVQLRLGPEVYSTTWWIGHVDDGPDLHQAQPGPQLDQIAELDWYAGLSDVPPPQGEVPLDVEGETVVLRVALIEREYRVTWDIEWPPGRSRPALFPQGCREWAAHIAEQVLEARRQRQRLWMMWGVGYWPEDV